MAPKTTDGTDAPQEKEHAVKLLGSSPADSFGADPFKEVLSPLVEPEDVADHQTIEALLQELGLLSNTPTTDHENKNRHPSDTCEGRPEVQRIVQ